MSLPASRRGNPAKKIDAVLSRFSRLRVLVVGDLMLDRYVWGRVSRLSPEAPVPVVRADRESLHPGGAANVAANVRALGGQPTVCGVVGRDAEARLLRLELQHRGIEVGGIVASSAYATIAKTRIIAHSQQVVRVDRDPPAAPGPRVGARLRAWVERRLPDFDVCIVSDYGKGVVDAALLARLADLRERLRFVYAIDPKRRNFPHYRGASLVKPNADEAEQASGVELDGEAGLTQAGRRLLERWHSEAVLISRGEAGLSLFRPGRAAAHFPTAAREVFDVTGAGDTVVAVCALALGAGADLETATRLANHAAGVAVGKVGTATVGPTELRAALR